MKIRSCSGFECEKAQNNSPEDLFNQSDVNYEHQGEEKVLNVTYVRYFDQYLQEQGIYDMEKTDVPFYQIYALLILLKNGGYVDAYRLYISDTEQFLASFDQKQIDEALSIYQSVHK